MAHGVKASVRDEALDLILDRLDGGFLRIYSGSRPATVDDPLGGAVLLAELTLGTPAFAAASAGSKAANAITTDNAANASGTASFYSLFLSNGTTRVVDGDCVASPGPGDLVLPTLSIVQNVAVAISSLVYTL